MGFNKEDVREGSVSGKDGISSCESGCYVYENEVTGMQQWHYPTPGAGAEDMDICTTPPPPPPDEPPPPPPPPPELSPPPAPFISNNLVEPLPPGTASPPLEAPPPPRITHVDLQNANVVMQHPNHLFIVEPTPQPPPNEALCAALSSFYSDLADLEPAASPQAAIIPSQGPQVAIQSIPMASQAASMFPSPNLWATTAQPEVPEKNKKKKVKAKVTTSVGLKNKSVSSMVEKWKKVQETLDD